MTTDELAANGYNIDKSYRPLMAFMRPHDSQLDYYERCHFLMDFIIERHQATGGTILIVARLFKYILHWKILYIPFFLLLFVFLDAPSLEGLTRHLSGGRLQPGLFFALFFFLF